MFAKAFLRVFSVAAFNLSLLSPVMSISLEEAQKKLDVVAVFVLVNENGGFYEIKRDDAIVIPLYLKASSAKKQLDALMSSQQGLKGNVRVYSLSFFYSQADKLRELARSKGGKLSTPVIVEESDMIKAKEILAAQGVSAQETQKLLRVPVFYAQPMLIGEYESGRRELFFLSHHQLLESITTLPQDKRDSIKVKVADIAQVLSLIKNTKEDKFAFVATKDYQEVREKVLMLRDEQKK